MSVGIRIGAKAQAKQQKQNGTFDTRDMRNLPINAMERDKTMVRMVRAGNVDKGLKREAEIIQREFENKRKQNYRANDQRELHQMKKEYGLLPEQLRRKNG